MKDEIIYSWEVCQICSEMALKLSRMKTNQVYVVWSKLIGDRNLIFSIPSKNSFLEEIYLF
jgi:hypothetical protein